MATRIDDRWLWLGFGVVFIFAVQGILYAMDDLLELTKIDIKHDSELHDQSAPPEDDINLNTLRTLAKSPNPSIAEAVKNILVTRFINTAPAMDSLARDTNSQDEVLRRRARTALRFITKPTGLGLGVAVDDEGFPLPPGLQRNVFEHDEFYTPASTPGLMGVDERMNGWMNVPRERPALGDNAEAERRRRRREAMVLHEGDGEVDEDDIIRLR